jgi:hypothetical protein
MTEDAAIYVKLLIEAVLCRAHDKMIGADWTIF